MKVDNNEFEIVKHTEQVKSSKQLVNNLKDYLHKQEQMNNVHVNKRMSNTFVHNSAVSQTQNARVK